MQEIKNRPYWTAPSGLKWVASRMLAALSAHRQAALRASFGQLLRYNMDLDVTWDLWSIHAKFLPGRGELGQQVLPVCIVRILLKGTCGRLACRSMHDCTWRGWGYFRHNPPTPRLGRVHARAIQPTWADVERPKWWAWQYSIYYVDDGRVQRFDFTWWKGALASPPPIDWVMHAHYHLLTQYSIKSQNKISNWNFKHIFFEIISRSLSQTYVCVHN